MKKYLVPALAFLILVACSKEWKPLYEAPETPRNVYRISAKTTIPQGNPEAGFAYLTTGDYIGSGFPWSFVNADTSLRKDTVLMRKGKNSHISWFYIATERDNDVTLVSGSCFNCHASAFEDSVYLALGNSFSDFTNVKPWQRHFFSRIVKKNASDAEWEQAEDYVSWLAHSFPWIQQKQVGLNPAFRLEEAFAAHRDPVTLAYSQREVFPNQGPNVASDVPPLWNVKKKNALYYNGMGRGDFTKLLMQAGMMGIPDTTKAREIQQRFVDVVAWLESLEAPKYPKTIDADLAEQGKGLFIQHCEKCHGTYDENPAFEIYPNKLVPMYQIETDPAYAQYFMKQSGLPDWFNQSWLGQSLPQAQMLPSNGYIAPPLDGVWATAPYLHNGSVPTLEDLLYSPQRPDLWARSGSTSDYDWEKVGYRYTTGETKGSVIYDCSQPGQDNGGHEFGDELTVAERKAVVEYVKGL